MDLFLKGGVQMLCSAEALSVSLYCRCILEDRSTWQQVFRMSHRLAASEKAAVPSPRSFTTVPFLGADHFLRLHLFWQLLLRFWDPLSYLPGIPSL